MNVENTNQSRGLFYFHFLTISRSSKFGVTCTKVKKKSNCLNSFLKRSFENWQGVLKLKIKRFARVHKLSELCRIPIDLERKC